MWKKDEEKKYKYESFSCNMRPGMQGYEPSLLAPLLLLKTNARQRPQSIYDCSMPMPCSRGQALEKDQAVRGENLKLSYQGLLAARTKFQVFCVAWQANLNKKKLYWKIQNWVKVSWTQKVKLVFACGIQKCVDMSLWIMPHYSKWQWYYSKTLSSKSACTHIWTASRWAESNDMETMAADKRCN